MSINILYERSDVDMCNTSVEILRLDLILNRLSTETRLQNVLYTNLKHTVFILDSISSDVS